MPFPKEKKQDDAQEAREEEHVDETVSAHPSTSRTICIAVDESKFSAYTLDWALDNILEPGRDHVVLLNVRPKVKLGSVLAQASIDLSAGHAALDKQNRDARGVALKGDAREEIVWKVEDAGADMLIMGSRGMGAVKRSLIGSVSDYAMHHADCAVIVHKE
ncbi:MAG: hypothetical protein SGCHY_004472 [Lobulomycetales sp.]